MGSSFRADGCRLVSCRRLISLMALAWLGTALGPPGTQPVWAQAAGGKAQQDEDKEKAEPRTPGKPGTFRLLNLSDRKSVV